MGKRTITQAQADELLDILGLQVADDDEGESDDAEETESPKKRGKKAAEADDESDDADDEGTDEDESDDSEDGPSLEEVIDAIREYVGKNKKGEREKAIALLKKNFKVGNVQKLDPDDFAKAIKLFSKK